MCLPRWLQCTHLETVYPRGGTISYISYISYIGEKKLTEGPKILVAPGTGLGLAGILGETVIATEAGHINISDKHLRPDLRAIIDRFP